MSEPAAPSLRLTGHRSFVLFWCARTFTNGAYMMQGVAVGWQIYDLTNNPLDLGLVGLVQFFPLIAMSVIAGQVLDLFDRRMIAGVCQIGKALAALLLAVGTAQGWLGREAMFAILFLSGTARAFEIPTMHSLLPGIVPVTLLPRAIAASATAQQTAVICGPSIGGLMYAFGPTAVYATCTLVFMAASALIGLIQVAPRPEQRKPVTLATVFAGFRYIRHQPIVLGAISLDLFAVLLGGVTALLPIYARDILEAGPWALGVLRSAPAVGAS
jgi:MFS family permease